MKPYADNVFIELEPLPEMSEGGLLHLPQQSWLGARGSRTAKVIASGPGHYLQKAGGARGTLERTAFVPTEVKPGDRVVVDALAGTVYDGDLSAPRHNQATQYGSLRVVREQEILAVLEDEA